MTMNFGECSESENVVCKHVRARKTFYVDLNSVLLTDVTLVSVDADSADENLEIESVTVLDEDTTIEIPGNCASVSLVAGRAIVIVLAAGTSSEDETVVTVNYEDSNGEFDSKECRLQITGTPAIESA